ncbi:MAG: sensor histidine kinase, partial [Psychrobacillus psychrodurans]
MKIKLLMCMILVVFAIGITFSIIIINKKDISKVDLVAINDVVKTVEKNWGQVSEETFYYSDIKQPFSIIDHLENVIYQTPGNHFNDIYEAIENRDTFIDLKQNNEIVGKIIIRNNEQELMDQMKRELVISVSFIFGLLAIFSIFYLYYINRTLLKPFQQLQYFAVNVARGNLEMPLKMDENNYFGAFTESFDLLRDELDASRQRE